MEKPSFKKTSAAKLDERLGEFFIQQLGYSAPVRNDPDEKPGDPHYWRMVYPLPNSRPFAVAYQANLSSMKRQDVARLYINKVVPHRDSTPAQPAPILYVFTDGARFVFFSADTARNRDDRFDLSEETWQFEGVRGKVEALHVSPEETPLAGSRDKVRYGKLLFQKRLGKLTPQVEFLFDSSHLSADNRFKNYVRDVRLHLMQEVVADDGALAAVIYHLLETPEAREGKVASVYADRSAGRKGDNYTLRKSLDELHLELKARLGDAVAAAVDTLLLRYVMMRFLEAYHPEAMEGLLGSKEMLKKGGRTRKSTLLDATTGKQLDATLYDSEGVRTSKFSQEELELARTFSRSLTVDASRARKARTRKGEAAQGDLYALQNVEVVLEEEEKRERALGGDFYLADLGQAARAIEETLLKQKGTRGSMLLQDFLGRTGETVEETGASRWQFRYEDLKPKTLQDYYEDSLSTAVQLTYNADTDEFKVEVATSTRQRKELGAYYTNEHLCRFMVERTVKPLFDERLERLRVSVERGTAQEARAAFESVMDFSVCDPTMGSAPFLRSAFDYLVESTQYFQLHRHVAALKGRHAALYEEIVRDYEFLGAKGGKLDASGIGGWEWHVLRRVLYGVDIDLKAVCIACQTFALSSMRHLKQGERFPSYFNINLKLGNALISPTRPADRARLAAEYGAEITELIRLRRRAQSLPNTEAAYAELVGLFKEADRVRLPIMSKLVEERVYPVLEDFTDELRPFSWELEFPEIFFNADGTLKESAGFDVIIGNPPWEEVKVEPNKFAASIGLSKEQLEVECVRNETVKQVFKHYEERINALKRAVASPLLFNYQYGGRTRNYWRMAFESSHSIANSKGFVSLVVPSGLIGEDVSRALKDLTFGTCKYDRLFAFLKHNQVFPDQKQAFAVFSYRKGAPTSALELIDGLISAEQLFEASLREVSAVPVDLIMRSSPDTWAIPQIENQQQLSLLELLYRHPLLRDKASTWNATTLSADYDAIRSTSRKFKYQIVTNENLKWFAFIPPAPEQRVNEWRARDSSTPRDVRIGWNDFPGNEAVRRMTGVVIPPGCAVDRSINVLSTSIPVENKLVLCSMLGSLTIEWRAIQIGRGNHMRLFVVDQLPFPNLESDGLLFANLAYRAALLAADGGCLPPEDAQALSRKFSGLQVGISSAHYDGLNWLRDILRPDERAQLLAQLDVLVAHAFGLSEELYELVLNRFERIELQWRQHALEAFTILTPAKD